MQRRTASEPTSGVAVPRTAPGPTYPALPAILDLLTTLNVSGIGYCHWKSNLRLPESLAGRTDLDLLVCEADRGAFRRLLRKYGVRQVLAPPGRRYPSLEDHLGFDRASGTIFHLHVHYRLVLGQQFVKNHELPLASTLLDNTTTRLGVRVPRPEFELIILAQRALLKYRNRDGIKDLLGIRSPGIPDHIRLEFEFLLRQTTPDRIERAIRTMGAPVPADSVRSLIEAISHSPRNGLRLLQLRGRVFDHLRRYQRNGSLRADLSYLVEMWRRRGPFLGFGSPKKMTSLREGKLMALVGADGSGKTSHAEGLQRWLGDWLEIRRYYLGSKQPSVASRLLYIAFRAARKAARDLSRAAGDGAFGMKTLIRIRQNLRYLHAVSIGLDRFRRYRRARWLQQKGVTVIFDRFPLSDLLDGPQVDQLAEGMPFDRIGKRLRALELGIYARMNPIPMIWLDVHPGVAEQRKPDHDRAVIAEKSRQLAEIHAAQSHRGRSLEIFRIDANRPYAEVFNQVQVKAWELLERNSVGETPS